ncbi:MAG: c-type cytochrome [Gammaproteobacteria bacterium]|nr:c-type cytochrome [Gammaproteobacteria bacterium]
MNGCWRTSGALSLALTALPIAAADVDAGRRIYEQGLPVHAQAALGTVQRDVAFNAEQLVCVNCHRRSGLGSGEGEILIPPVTGDLLFRPRSIERPELWGARTEGEGTRPAYTPETLARAIRSGIDAAGRPLDPLMPRYDFDDARMAALIAYLGALSSRDAPGVNATEIHFATVSSDRLAPSSEAALLNVLHAFFASKNAQTRREGRRAAHPPWHKDKQFPAWRTWVLHHWRLTGPRDGWPAQLEAHYRTQPVFAILGGSVGGSWAPVHAFAEAHGVPTLFPHTDQPEAHGYYTFYANEGAVLRARAIAQDLAQRPVQRVIQVTDPHSATSAGAMAFRTLWRGSAEVTDVELPRDAARLVALLAEGSRDAVLWWPDASAAASPPALRAAPRLLYLAGSSPRLPASVPMAAEQVIAIHPYRLPDALEAGIGPLHHWLEARGLQAADPPLMADAFLAATAAGEALMHMNTHFSRHYFIEKLEHGLGRNTFSGYYPRLSSAPGQRFLSKGSYIVELDRSAKPVRHRWVVP